MNLASRASLFLLAGALSATGSLAKEARPHARPAASPSAKAGEHEPVRHGDIGKAGREHTGEGSSGAAANSPGGAGKEAPIDTRITVQPRAIKKPSFGSAKSAVAAPAPRAMNPPQQTIAPQVRPSSRNAIGIPLDQHANTLRASAALPHGSMARGEVMPTASRDSDSAIHASANPALAGTRLQNGAAVTGTGVSRPGSGPGTLGGPAKNVGIIIGTSTRPKR
jgi:hypothetical protein